MDEIWKDIIGYEGLYQASSLGRIKSLSRIVNGIGVARNTRKETVLKSQVINSGYKVSTFCINYKKKNFFVHRIIAECFVPNLDNKAEVNHINGVKTDNSADNLEWVTGSENKKHAYRIGLRTPIYVKFGSDNHQSKRVYQYDFNGILLNSYGSIKEASVESGVAYARISANARDETKTAGGFIWRYEQI